MVFSTHDTAAARLRALDAMTRGSNSSFEVDSDTEKDKSLIDPPLDDDVEESKRFLVARSSSWPLPLERVTRGMGNLTMSGVNSTVHYVEGKAKDVKSSVDNRWNRFKMKRRIDEYKSTTMKGAREEQCGVMLDLQADESKTTTVESRGTFDEDWSDITASQIGLSKIPVSDLLHLPNEAFELQFFVQYYGH
ncbi:hypothetical protein I203_102604 [Kwoniella mangroviensis CBS 8507]|uniref:uncharacterized protein n=1 Tax=Kwoniella mangroviensis CBS 8507 TaxID=1296122 RepID=UPI0030409E60